MKKKMILPLLALGFLSTGLVQAESIKIATFNAEFLLMNKVHMKFGLPFDLKPEDDPQWSAVHWCLDQPWHHYRQLPVIIPTLRTSSRGDPESR